MFRYAFLDAPAAVAVAPKAAVSAAAHTAAAASAAPLDGARS